MYLSNIADPTLVQRGNELALAQAIAKHGPVSVCVDASQVSFQLYEDGVYDEKACSSTQLDHAVLAVGYDSKSFIIKNSWGKAPRLYYWLEVSTVFLT